MMLLAKPSTALGFGAFFLCAVSCTHSNEITTSPLSLIPDWTASAFLIGGAIKSGRAWAAGRTYQIAAWAFMASLLFHSFLGNLEEWLSPNQPDAATELVSLSQ